MAKIPAGAKVETREIPAGAEVQTEPTRNAKLTEAIQKQRETSTLDDAGKFASDVGAKFMGNTRAALNSASLNFLPRVRAAGDALVETLNGHGGPLENYGRALSEQQASAAKDAQDNPEGDLAGPFLVPPIAKGLSLAQRLVAAGGSGAASGYFRAPHDNPEAQRAGALNGGLGGIAMQGGAETVSPLARLLSGELRNVSGNMAANVAGGGKGQIGDRLKAIGVDPMEQADFGNTLLDEGLIPTGLHPTKSPAVGVLERSRALKDKSGKAIGAEIQSADVSGHPFDPIDAQQAMRGRLGGLPLERANQGKANTLVEQVGELTPQGEYAEGGGFVDANKTKSQAWQAANFKDDAPMAQQQYRKAVSGLRDNIRDQVGAANGPASADRLTKANQQFGVASDAENLASNAVSRGGQSQQFGLPAALAMVAGGALGGAAGGGAGAAGGSTAGLIGSALIKSRGPAMAARGGRFGSDLAATVANRSQNPTATGGSGSALADYLRPKDDEERQEEGAAHFTAATGGR